MTLIRATTILAGLTGKPESRKELSTGVQLVGRGRVVWAKKPFWFRNAPYTVGPYAHDGQIEIRLMFANAAHQAKGMKGLDPETGLPHAAAHVMRKLTGATAPHRMDPAKYPSKIQRTAYREADLIAEARRRGLGTPAYVPPARV
ncbi:MAG: hypothetical protein DRO09_00185 [Thermoprotei archaeon]|nr:MAG: hypothetical protein DRO09_00185 [Thermoprotei archaeon]